MKEIKEKNHKIEKKVNEKPKNIFTDFEKKIDRNLINRLERDGYKNLNRIKKFTFVSISLWILYEYYQTRD